MPVSSSRSPFQEGFSALREEPLLIAAELTWRWTFGLVAWLLALTSAVLFLDSVKISALDRYLLGTMQPALERAAVHHVFDGALLRFAWIKFILLAGLTGLWAFAAAAGRAATLRNLVALSGGEDRDEGAGWQFRPMLQLHLLRALWTWIALACFAASFLLGYSMTESGHAARGAFFYVFGVALSLVFGLMLNWIFGLAPLFCIRNQATAHEAVASTLDFCTRQGGRVFGLSLAFLALRIVWAGSMFFIVLAPTGLGKHMAVGCVLVMMFALALVYFAGADILYMARLGAYAVLAEMDAEPGPTPVAPQAPIDAQHIYPGLPLPETFDGLPDFSPG